MIAFAIAIAEACGHWPALGVLDIPHRGRYGLGFGVYDRFKLVPEDAENGGRICGQGAPNLGMTALPCWCIVAPPTALARPLTLWSRLRGVATPSN